MAPTAVDWHVEDARTASWENYLKTVKTHSSRACRARVTMSRETGEFSPKAQETYSVSRERKAEHRRPKRAALSNLRRPALSELRFWSP